MKGPSRVIAILVMAALVVAAGSAQAAESDTQMKLCAVATGQTFLTRVAYLMVQQARSVKDESDVTTNHAARVAYAHAVIQNPVQYAQGLCPLLVGGTNLVSPNATTTCSGTPETCSSSVTDAAMLSQIATFWTYAAVVDP